jgi:hypothetical protein
MAEEFQDILLKMLIQQTHGLSNQHPGEERHHIEAIVARMRGLYKTGIGLTTGFIGSNTVTHNYSVYSLQLNIVHYNTCRVFTLYLHWLPVFQYRRIRSPATLL